jgi:pseudaminic acid synthase
MEEAVRTLRAHGTKELSILHCNSGYPAAFDEANLKTIPAIAEIFNVVPGISDHTIYADDKNYRHPMAHVTTLEAVKFGAKIIEVHLLLDREKARKLNEKQEGGFDWPFSREPEELKRMIDMVRAHEHGENPVYDLEEERAAALRTHGCVTFEPTAKEMASRTLRPSLWVVKNVGAGEAFKFAGGKPGNVDSIRPGGGLHVRFADFIDGRKAARDLKAGMPLSWDMVELP